MIMEFLKSYQNIEPLIHYLANVVHTEKYIFKLSKEECLKIRHTFDNAISTISTIPKTSDNTTRLETLSVDLIASKFVFIQASKSLNIEVSRDFVQNLLSLLRIYKRECIRPRRFRLDLTPEIYKNKRVVAENFSNYENLDFDGSPYLEAGHKKNFATIFEELGFKYTMIEDFGVIVKIPNFVKFTIQKYSYTTEQQDVYIGFKYGNSSTIANNELYICFADSYTPFPHCNTLNSEENFIRGFFNSTFCPGNNRDLIENLIRQFLDIDSIANKLGILNKLKFLVSSNKAINIDDPWGVKVLEQVPGNIVSLKYMDTLIENSTAEKSNKLLLDMYKDSEVRDSLYYPNANTFRWYLYLLATELNERGLTNYHPYKGYVANSSSRPLSRDNLKLLIKNALYQPKLWQEIITKPTVSILFVGLGSIGSYVAPEFIKYVSELEDINLKVTLIDFDIVEPKNIKNQNFTLDDVGKFKVDAVKQTIIKNSKKTHITAFTRKYDRDVQINNYDLVITAVDTSDKITMHYDCSDKGIPMFDYSCNEDTIRMSYTPYTGVFEEKVRHTETLLEGTVNKSTLPIVTRNSPKLAIGLIKFLMEFGGHKALLLESALKLASSYKSLELFKVYEDGKETYSKLFKSKKE